MIHRSIVLKVYMRGNKRSKTIRVQCPAGKHFTSAGIEQNVAHYADQLERLCPTEDFRMVQVGPAAFNFIHEGPRKAAA